jgi:hypothetical protein
MADEQRAGEETLLRNIKAQMADLRTLLEECDDHWGAEDLVYRFYHQSFKVYAIQHLTERIVTALNDLLPYRPLDGWFMKIVEEGTGRNFGRTHNKDWPVHTRPMLEAYWHARYMLGMVVRYGEQFNVTPPQELAFGWAAVLCLYHLR